MTSAAPSPRERWLATGVVFLATAAVFRAWYAAFPVQYDADGYYHLAVARAYAADGLLGTLEWARFSIMHEGFGDKELLFHVLLAPFAARPDAQAAGFTALAFLDAGVAAVLAWAGMRAIGRWGLVLPLLVLGGATDFTLRLVRLRPEIVSLLLLIATIGLASARRWALLGIVACLYALAYTAVQALVGLCALFFLQVLWVERRAEWRLVLVPLAGVMLGLVVHPGFPANVRVWAVQNVDFFVHKDALDVGAEILPRTTRDLLLLNLGWWAGLLALWRSREPCAPRLADTRLRDFTLVAATAFGVLYLLMARFVTYFVPFATLAVARTLQAAGEAPGRRVRLAWRGTAPLGLCLGLCLAAVPLQTLVGWRRMQASARSFRAEARADLEAFGRAVPAGARILAPWSATHQFVFWAPQGRYLNVLDPVFMVARDPAAHRRLLALLEGREADVPLAALAGFESEFFADDGQYPRARTRLLRDPRVERLHDGATYLYRFVPGANRDFLLDWTVLPSDVAPTADRIEAPDARRYPRDETAEGRALEGYVDGRRLGPVEGCATFARIERVEGPTQLLVEVAPYGPGDVLLDGRLLAAVPAATGAVLGQGVLVPLALEPGTHVLAVRTCPVHGQLGFYALVRRREAAG